SPNGRYIKDAEIAQAVAQNFEDIGLKVNLKVMEWSLYASVRQSGDHDEIYLLGLGAPFSGEQELNYLHPQYSLNYTYWENEEWNAKFAELNETLDRERRLELMYELQEIVMDECPWIPLWHQVDFYGVTKTLPWEGNPTERIF